MDSLRMVTMRDEAKGLVKGSWGTVRNRVAQVNGQFAKLIDALSPDDRFPLYLAYYPYGALKGDTISTFIPTEDGEYYRLTDPSAPKDVIKHLGYGKKSAPLAMLLDKNLELFIDLKSEGITIPWLIYKPGDFLSFARNLGRETQRVYAPNGILSLASGARSTFMLPNIGCTIHHANLQRDFNIKHPAAKSIYDHWHVFKAIASSPQVNCDWRSCLIYFSQGWVDKIYSDSAWSAVKNYLHNLAWSAFEYERNQVFYDTAFSLIQKNRNLKPNPYLVDTARHLFTTALGVAPGYSPSVNEGALPLDTLEMAFIESYGLKKYTTTVMQPEHYYFEEAKLPIYYSLQNPSTYVFSPASRAASSTLFDIRELSHIVSIFQEELAKENNICADTVIHEVAKNILFKYFHNKTDTHKIVSLSKEIPTYDARFRNKEKKSLANFSADAAFLRGCVSISTKQSL